MWKNKIPLEKVIDIKCMIFNYLMENMKERYKPKTKSEKTNLLNFIGNFKSFDNFENMTGMDFVKVYEKAVYNKLKRKK